VSKYPPKLSQPQLGNFILFGSLYIGGNVTSYRHHSFFHHSTEGEEEKRRLAKEKEG